MSEHEIAIDIDDPTEIFAESKGEARIDEHELAAIGPAGVATLIAAIKAYHASHPKLDVVYLMHRGGVDELVIRWRWRL